MAFSTAVVSRSSQLQGRRGLLKIVILLLLTGVTSLPQKGQNSERIYRSYIAGCLPCSQQFIIKSYFEKHDNLVDSDYETYFHEEFPGPHSCKFPQPDANDMPELSISSRYLSGEGSHRHMATSIKLDIHATMSMFDAELCEAVVIERLPAGVFADPFELQPLVHRDVLSDAAVFGDTNLELPSALCNRTVVEIHKSIGKYKTSQKLNAFEFNFEIPLHARYHPLDSKSYSSVMMQGPDILLRCTPIQHQYQNCSSLLFRWNVPHTSDIAWEMPCGNKSMTKFVDILTFASAIASAVLIVVFSLHHSSLK